MDEYINKHEAWQAIEHEAQTHELPASKEAYERAAMNAIPSLRGNGGVEYGF